MSAKLIPVEGGVMAASTPKITPSELSCRGARPGPPIVIVEGSAAVPAIPPILIIGPLGVVVVVLLIVPKKEKSGEPPRIKIAESPVDFVIPNRLS